MIKRISLLAAIILAAMAFFSKPTYAQDEPVWEDPSVAQDEVVLDPADPLVFSLKATASSGPAAGFWRVGVYFVSGNEWEVQVYADGGSPNLDALQVSMAFYSTTDLSHSSNRIQVLKAGTDGGIIATTGPPDLPPPVPVTGTRTNWMRSRLPGDAASFQPGDDDPLLLKDNSNVFSATIHLQTAGEYAVHGFTIGVQNGDYQWNGTAITAEASSLALLLPGLLPLGIALRRRRRSPT